MSDYALKNLLEIDDFTPDELADVLERCADPARPCLIATFLVADPPLKQVVSRTLEAGVRGTLGEQLQRLADDRHLVAQTLCHQASPCVRGAAFQ